MASTATQVGLLLWKNVTVRRRKPLLLATELLLPLVLLAVLCGIRYRQPAERMGQTSYYGRVLPSAGLIPVLESLFCTSSGEPDGYGFKRYPNSSSTAILEYLQRHGGRWPPGGDTGDHPADLGPSQDVCDDSLGPAENRTATQSVVLLWGAVQMIVCGQTPPVPPPMNSTADFIDYLGVDPYHQGRLAILFHMITTNTRIPFAPNTTQAWRIVRKVNETMDYVAGLSDAARLWLRSPPPPDHTLPVPAAQLTLISCAWLQLMGGADLDWFRPFPTEEAAVQYFLGEGDTTAAADNATVFAVLAFDLPPDDSLPSHLTYKIRQNASLTANTAVVRDRAWLPGPRSWDYNYYEFGFSWLQDLVERAVTSLHAGRPVLEPASAVQEMPYPCFIRDSFLFYLQTVMPLCVTLGWVCGVTLQVLLLVQEREDRLREVMLTLGISVSAVRLSWVLTALVVTLPSVVAVTLVLCYGGILRYSSVSLVFCLLMLFAADNIAVAHLLSALCPGRARTAAAASTILYFLAYVPYIYVSVIENTAMQPVSTPVKVITCLLSPSAFNLAFKYVGFYEQQGSGVDWSTWTVSPVENDQFSLALTMLLMLLDILLYAIVIWYAEAVCPGSAGVPQPWYFPVTLRYWCPSAVRDGGRRAGEEGSGAEDGPTEDGEAGLLSEREPSDLKLAVELSGVSWRFRGQPRPAVDQLSLRLYQGQVTALLGHNGAGKTTTMSMLCGLLPCQSGSVTVYGLDTRRELSEVRRALGFCPQQDVLVDGLTPAEHLWMYARVRGATDDEADMEVISVLADIDLLTRRDLDVRHLSGGQRRKLSVAIAFLGGSRCIVLDEPTAGVDPHSRRAIWRLIAKYKHGRTILLCTHHMEEADMLSNRIAIVADGRVRCVGSPMFLRRQLGADYHLHVVRTVPTSSHGEEQNELTSSPREGEEGVTSSPGEGEEGTQTASLATPAITNVTESSPEVTKSPPGVTEVTGATSHPQKTEDSAVDSNAASVLSLLRRRCAGVRLLRTSAHELHFLLPPVAGAGAAAGGSGLPELLEELQRHGRRLGVTSYGLQTTSMEDVFLRLTRHSNGAPEPPPDPDSDRATPPPCDVTAAADVTPRSDVTEPPLSGRRLLWQQFVAVLLKRFYCTRRNWSLLISQVLLPAFFTFLAMSVAIVAPVVTDKPALVMAPTQYFNYSWPDVVPVVSNRLDVLNPGFSTDAPSTNVSHTLRLVSGLGATCVLRDPHNASAGFDPLCNTVRHHGDVSGQLVFRRRERSLTHRSRRSAGQQLTTMPPSQQRLYPECRCRADGAGQECRVGGYSLPVSWPVTTGDLLQNITGQPETEFYRATTDIYRLRRYGGLSLGLVHDVTPPQFGQGLSTRLRRTAVRRLAKAWFNNKGFHAVPAFVNAINNAVLRANLPESAGDPAGYGITCVNHPLPRTSTFFLEEQIRQGTDVLIALMVLVAQSFVPASLVLALVQERRRRTKHLQLLCGLDGTVYWLANYCWDLLNCSLPSAACVLIIVAFGDPAYASASNLPAVALLIFLYGWSMTPLMYPVTFAFREPASAYIAVVIFNLFVGAAALLTTSMFESLDDTEVVDVLKKIFLVLPNYCMGRGLLEIAYNQYHNEFLTKTGSYSRMLSPLSVARRYLISMAVMAAVGLVVTLTLQLRPFARFRPCCSKPEDSAREDGVSPREDEDEDVAVEGRRVTSGAASGDILKLERLTKAYRGAGTAVDRLCVGVARGECFGLLGVNGAGKTSTFRMLTGETAVTSGDALVKLQRRSPPLDVSVRWRLSEALSEVGYCPQQDALHGEMTVAEHLRYYARIRGVPPASLLVEVAGLLTQLDLTRYADRPADALSGGNKRKLSTALALVGGPRLLLLDEPTSGMDPASRRFLWDLVRRLVSSGRSVLLTSHSMAECETLCTRLAVMVNGRLRCLGSPQHLKHRFGDGYTVTIRCGAGANPSAVDTELKCRLPVSRLKECHLDVWTYEVGVGSAELPDLLRQLEKLAADCDIDDWYISQNTLDSVFVSLARHQSECVPEKGEAETELTYV
ncbi:ATP-binding cassette sub-family A member 2-like [Amphibalanus amphitrite]|uniref:ATP-binding cassette sub-family A member 2-like n=1 Tax=Amphibalanus amphitrite TaxID=1232801 RepID=UPI001C92B679|nr:ATP-binding cassette sub-family A member 2-like [Amphibalanus amphitrite]XP_043210385.1 ATP-binding cassette sub-family A member 2-like [Amphibalanus amphitrite]